MGGFEGLINILDSDGGFGSLEYKVENIVVIYAHFYSEFVTMTDSCCGYNVNKSIKGFRSFGVCDEDYVS